MLKVLVEWLYFETAITVTVAYTKWYNTNICLTLGNIFHILSLLDPSRVTTQLQRDLISDLNSTAIICIISLRDIHKDLSLVLEQIRKSILSSGCPMGKSGLCSIKEVHIFRSVNSNQHGENGE